MRALNAATQEAILQRDVLLRHELAQLAAQARRLQPAVHADFDKAALGGRPAFAGRIRNLQLSLMGAAATDRVVAASQARHSR